MLLTGKIWEFMAYLTLPILYILIKRHIHIAVRTLPGVIGNMSSINAVVS